MTIANSASSNSPVPTKTQQVSELVQLVSQLAGKATKIQASLNQPQMNPEDAGVVFRERKVKTVERFENGITTRTKTERTEEKVDEALRQKLLREAAVTTLPGLVTDFLKDGVVDVDGVKVTQEELLTIQKKLNELGLGDLLKRFLPGSRQTIDMDMLDLLLKSSGGLNDSSGDTPGSTDTHTVESDNNLNQTVQVAKEDNASQGHQDLPVNQQIQSPSLDEGKKSGSGFLRRLLSPFTYAKKRLSEALMNQALSAVQAKVEQTSDADIANAVRNAIANLTTQPKK